LGGFQRGNSSLNIFDELQVPAGLNTFLGRAAGKGKHLVPQTKANF
jgi:hypothetical protein